MKTWSRKAFSRHSLRFQLLALVVGAVALSLTISMLSALLIQWGLQKEQLTRSLETTARSTATAVSAAVAFGDAQAAAEALRILAPQKEIVAAAVYRDDGGRLAIHGQAALLPPDSRQLREHGPDLSPLSEATTLFLPIRLDDATLGWIYLRADLSQFRDGYLRQSMLAILASLCGLGLAIWLGMGFIDRIVGPVRGLASLAHQVRKSEDFGLRASSLNAGDANDEIAELVLSFNAMLAEIEKRKNEVLDYQRDLEDRVDERTSQLAMANTALQDEIRARARSEALIRASEEKLRGLFELAPLGIALCDMGGRFVEFNAAFQAITGYSADELKRLDYWALTPDAYRAEENRQLDSLRRIGRYGPYEKAYRRKDGSLVPINLNGRLVTGADGQAYIWSIVEDISTRKLAEAQMLAQKQSAEEANQAKSRFLAAASHDLRQPLHALGLLVSALIERLDGAGCAGAGHAEMRRLAGLIDTSARNMASLLNELLDLSRLEAGVVVPRPDCVPVDEAFGHLNSRFQPLALDKGLRLRFVPCRLAVETDPVLLDRILANLVTNAIRYTSRGGILVGARRRGEDGLRIDVIDTGRGIPETMFGQIFEEYFQLDNPERDRDKGQGLGLSIVKRLVALLGLRIEVSSRLGHGSRFSLDLPRCEARQSRRGAERGTRLASPPGQGKLVALVEDDEVILVAMRSLLEQWGIDLIAAPSLDGVLDALASGGRRPDLILSDYRLPGEHDGIGVVARFRARYGDELPGVLITGDTGEEAIQAITRSGLRVMYKPLQPAKLRALLMHLLK
jgi:PAS domain S-box-containing protein